MNDSLSIKREKLIRYGNEKIGGLGGVSDALTIRNIIDNIDTIPKGGLTPSTKSTHMVRYMDHNGVFFQKPTKDFTVSDIPVPPDYTADNLTFQNYNIDMSIKQIDPNRSYDIGASYITTDGHTYIRFVNNPVVGYQFQIRLVAKLGTGTVTMHFDDGESISVEDSITPILYTKDFINDGLYTIKTVRIERTGDAEYYIKGETTINVGFGTRELASKVISCNFGDGVTMVGGSSFNYCKSLAIASIPYGITSIEAFSFLNCHSLFCISIPSSTVVLKDNIFPYCYFLKYISIPDHITKIESYLFFRCYGLSKIIIPERTINIMNEVFGDNYGLVEYNINAINPPILDNINSFKNINTTARIFVPDESVDAYKSATNWATYADYIYPMSKLNES